MRWTIRSLSLLFLSLAVCAFVFAPNLTAKPTVGPLAADDLVSDPYLGTADVSGSPTEICHPCFGNCEEPVCSSGCHCKWCGGQFDCNR